MRITRRRSNVATTGLTADGFRRQAACQRRSKISVQGLPANPGIARSWLVTAIMIRSSRSRL